MNIRKEAGSVQGWWNHRFSPRLVESPRLVGSPHCVGWLICIQQCNLPTVLCKLIDSLLTCLESNSALSMDLFTLSTPLTLPHTTHTPIPSHPHITHTSHTCTPSHNPNLYTSTPSHNSHHLPSFVPSLPIMIFIELITCCATGPGILAAYVFAWEWILMWLMMSCVCVCVCVWT